MIPCSFEITLFPLVLEFVDSVCDLIQSKVHTPHVARCHLRFEFGDDAHPFFDGLVHTAARRRLDYRVRLGFDTGGNLPEKLEVACGFSGLRVTDVDMYNTRPRLSRGNAFLD
jgi:hypothetical protein